MRRPPLDRRTVRRILRAAPTRVRRTICSPSSGSSAADNRLESGEFRSPGSDSLHAGGYRVGIGMGRGPRDFDASHVAHYPSPTPAVVPARRSRGTRGDVRRQFAPLDDRKPHPSVELAHYSIPISSRGRPKGGEGAARRPDVRDPRRLGSRRQTGGGTYGQFVTTIFPRAWPSIRYRSAAGTWSSG